VGFSLKKLLTGAVAQVNPWDNGKTFDTVQRGVAPTPPPAATLPTPGQAPANFARAETAPKRNLWERGWDQVNFADNGRTWQNAAPKVKDPFAEAQKLNVHDFTGNNTKVNEQVLPDQLNVLQIDAKTKTIKSKGTSDSKSFAESFATMGKSYKQAYVQQALELARQGDADALASLTALGREGKLDEDATGISATNPLINFARAGGKGIVSGGAAVAEGFNKTPVLNSITPVFTAGDPGGRKAAEESIAWGKQKGKENEFANPTGVGGVTRQAGNMAPVLAASSVNPVAGIATGYGQGTGMTYDALKESGMSENKARLGGVAAGVPAGFLAWLGAKGVLNPSSLVSGAASKLSPELGAAVTTKLVSSSATIPGKVITNAVLRTPLELATGAGQQVTNNIAMNVGGVKTGILDNVGEAAKQNLITAQATGAALDVAPAVRRGVTTKLVSGVKKVPEIAARAMETPKTAELQVTNNRLQQQFENTTDARQRAIINKEIARNNAEIRTIKQGGYIRLSDGEDITPGEKNAKDYGMTHRPNDDGPRAHDMTETDMLPKDYYDHPEWYGANLRDSWDQESLAAVKSIRNKPEAEVTVYRAGPSDELNTGDWISFSKDYAGQHARETGDKVHAFKVKANELKFAGDSINEFGFYPGKGDSTDAAIQTRLSERPENLRKIEQSKVDMPDSERLALADGDTGQAGLQTSKSNRDKLLAKTRALADRMKIKDQGGFIRLPGDETPDNALPNAPRDFDGDIIEPKSAVKKAAQRIEETAKYMRDHDVQNGGVEKIATESEVGGGMDYSRRSKNNEFYREFYAANKRKPTLADYRDEARRILEGGQNKSYPIDELQVQEYKALRDASTQGQEQAPIEAYDDGTVAPTKPTAAILPSKSEQSQPIVGPVQKNAGSSKGTIPQSKKSGFAEGVTRSGEVSTELQSQVKKNAPDYTPVKNADQIESATKLVNKGYKKAAEDVQERLQAKTGTIDDQTVADSIEVIKRLDAKGGADNMRQATEVVERLSEHLTKAGQTVQAASLLSNRTPQGLLYGAIKTLKGAGVKITPELQGKLDVALKEVKATKGGTPEGDYARFKFIETVNKNTPSSAVGKAVQIWKAGLLTAPTTTAGNITANTLEQVVKRGYVDVVQTGLDQVFSVFTGKRSKSLTARGVASGAKEGALKGVDYFKTGYDPRNPNSKFDIREIHYSDKPLGKAAEAYTQGVFRLMGSQDQPFYYASLRNSLADQAITAAKNQGLKGTARTEFIKKFVTEPDTKVMQLADTEARYDVFQNKTALGERATKIKSGSALGDFLIPFSGVPSSIATRIIERTPVGAAHEIVKQVRSGKFDQRRMTQALANGTTGMVMAGAGAALAGAGEMTLGYPQDEKERKLWELEGKQAYSVKVGNKWVSLNYFQPAGVLMAAGGAYKQAVDEGKTPAEALSIAAANTGKAFTEQTFLKGVSGALNAVNDPKRSASRFLESTAGSVVPNFIRSIARSNDPKKREINGVLDSVVGGIPKLREGLLEDRDAFGAGMDRPSSGVNSFVSPARPSDIKPGDATTKEIRRLYDADLGVMPTDIRKDTFGKDNKLDDKQVNELNATIQPQIKQAWDAIVSDPRYADMSDEDKRDTLRDASETIYGLEKKKFEAKNSIGAYSSSLTPEEAEKKQKLSTKQKSLAEGTGVDFLNTDDTETADTPAARYKKAQESYDKKAPKMSDIEKTKEEKSLRVLKVKSDYDDDTVELQSMSKSDLWDYVSKSPSGKDQLAKVIALDDAMVAAGIYEKSKYRDKYGNITVGPKKAAGSGGKGKGGKKGKASKYGSYKLYGLASSASSSGTDKALASILKNARLS
jgi:hypothetical protein